jgi:hypothetical protein
MNSMGAFLKVAAIAAVATVLGGGSAWAEQPALQAPHAGVAAPGPEDAQALEKALRTFVDQEQSLSVLRDGVLRYFAVRLAGMKHAVWFGDTRSERTAFVFVDYGSKYAMAFLDAVEKFTEKAGVRCLVLPAYLEESERPAALAAAGLAIAGAYPAFFETRRKAPRAYGGAPLDGLSGDEDKRVEAAAGSVEAAEQADLARLVLLALGAKQPTMLRMAQRTYVGDLTDAEAMTAFFAERSDAAKASESALESYAKKSVDGAGGAPRGGAAWIK